MKKITLYIVFIALPIITLAAGSAPTGGIVPQGCQAGCPCTLCDFYMLGHNIINFLLYAGAIPIAAIMILWGGVLMLTSQGNENRITQGKTAITNAIIGLALAFFAWVIINALLTSIVFEIKFLGSPSNWFNPPTCKPGGGDNSCTWKIPPPVTGGPGPQPTTDTTQPLGADNTSWTSLQNAMSQNGAACPEGTGAACIARNRGCTEASNYGTCLGGLKPNTVNGIQELQANCHCKLTINGGSEVGGPGGIHDGTGPTGTTAGTHPGGDKVDYAPTSDLTAYILKNATPAGSRRDGTPLYKQGNIIYANEGNHWDVCYANCK